MFRIAKARTTTEKQSNPMPLKAILDENDILVRFERISKEDLEEGNLARNEIPLPQETCDLTPSKYWWSRDRKAFFPAGYPVPPQKSLDEAFAELNHMLTKEGLPAMSAPELETEKERVKEHDDRFRELLNRHPTGKIH